MLKHETPEENVSDTVDSLAARIQFVVGVDEENCAHCYSPAADEIRVYDVGEDYEVGDYIDSEDKTHVESLEETSTGLPGWMRYVQLERGWALTTHRAPDGDWTDNEENR